MIKLFWNIFERTLLLLVVGYFYWFGKDKNSGEKFLKANYIQGGLPRPKKLWFDFLYKPREARWYESIDYEPVHHLANPMVISPSKNSKKMMKKNSTGVLTSSVSSKTNPQREETFIEVHELGK